MASVKDNSVVAVIADEDTVTGFLLAGVGQLNAKKQPNFLIVDGKTTQATIGETFKKFCNREEICMILISQSAAEIIRHLVDAHKGPLPAVLEIPSKEKAYDPDKDSVMQRVKMFFGEGP
eukprot:GFYU01008627.1.p1 GENE.GFYU01008627.1~~GFYU01008627.1.p1  ORF type:complete len:120 (+),score=35.27 GFYU01008627.1:109-468(+)